VLTTLAKLPAEGAPELLFLLFHGHAQDESAMQPLAVALAADYPQAAVLCVRAPHPADVLPGRSESTGYQYFSRLGVDDQNRAERVLAAVPGFVAQVRQLQQQFSLSWERTALAGFSQGAIVALEAVQAEPRLAGRVLAFGGRHALQPVHAPEDTTLHLFHGLADAVVPYAPIVDSAERLVALGGDVTADVLPQIGHELHPVLINKALEQLRTFLPKKVWREAMAEAPVLSRPVSSRELDGPRPDRTLTGD
jgi:phospholipase/carboxylesterase